MSAIPNYRAACCCSSVAPRQWSMHLTNRDASHLPAGNPNCGIELEASPFEAEIDEERDAALALSARGPKRTGITTLCKLRGVACTNPLCGAADARARYDWR